MGIIVEAAKAIKHRWIRYANRARFVWVGLPQPVISFTFDDFPCSAYREAGRRILEKYTIRGTYYTSFGLMGSTQITGEQFSREDLEGALTNGHEIGCHTLNHANSANCTCLEYEGEVLKNITEAEKMLNGYRMRNFAFPYGSGSYRLKRRLFRHFKSLRGNLPGINAGWVDLGELRGNRLYSKSIDLRVVRGLIEENARRSGWLIFYTHDVCDKPSIIGCNAGYLEEAVGLAIRSGSMIRTVDRAVDYIRASPRKKET